MSKAKHHVEKLFTKLQLDQQAKLTIDVLEFGVPILSVWGHKSFRPVPKVSCETLLPGQPSRLHRSS